MDAPTSNAVSWIYLTRMVSTIAIWGAVAYIFSHTTFPVGFGVFGYLAFLACVMGTVVASMHFVWQVHFPPGFDPSELPRKPKPL